MSKLHYISNLEAPKTTINHSDCGERTCKAYQINKDMYETKHATPDCPCQKLQVDGKKLAQIFESGGLPVLFLDSVEDNGIEKSVLRVERWTPDIPYVVISHVWADEMGDPSSNALPEC